MTLEVTLSHRIDDVDIGKWTAVTGSGYTNLSPHWLRAVEVLSPPTERPLYVRIDEHGAPYAVAVAVDVRARTLLRSALLRMSLVFGSPHSAHPTIAIRPGVDAAVALPRVAGVLARVARAKLRPTCTIFVHGDEHGALLESRGFHLFEQPPVCMKRLEWPTYDDYLRSLSSRWRRTIGRNRRHAERCGIRIDLVDSRDADPTVMWDLFKETCFAKGNRTVGGYRENLFAVLPSLLPWEQRVFLARLRGEVVAFFWAISDGSTVVLPYGGLRYAVTRKTRTYVVLLADALRWAIESGHRECWIGSTNHHMKRRIGFDVVRRHAAVRLSFSSSRALFSPLTPLLAKQFAYRDEAVDSEADVALDQATA